MACNSGLGRSLFTTFRWFAAHRRLKEPLSLVDVLEALEPTGEDLSIHAPRIRTRNASKEMSEGLMDGLADPKGNGTSASSGPAVAIAHDNSLSEAHARSAVSASRTSISVPLASFVSAANFLHAPKTFLLASAAAMGLVRHLS